MSDHARDHADRHGLGGPDELDVRALASGTASSSTFLRGDRTWAAASGSGTSDHGALTGLADDDHTQYQLRSEKAAASGYASLDSTTKVPIAQVPTGSTSFTVCIGDDSRLSDARTPTTHASSHATAGSDPLTPGAIGAATSSALTTHTGATTSVHGISDTANLVYTADSRLTDARTPTAHKTSHATGGSDALAPSDIGAIATSAIGSTVQGYDGDLAAIAALSPANDDFIQRKSGAWTNRTIAQAKTDLGIAPPTVQVLTNTATSTYTTPSGCTAILVEAVGAGGGGGGVSAATSQSAGAGGGAAGAYLRELIASPAGTYSYRCGTRGSGGAAGNNSGAAGTSTTFGSLTAPGGGGGTGMASGTAIAIARGGLETTGASGGDVNGYGADGGTGVRYSASVNFAGHGGSSVFGGGGRAQDGNGAGNAAVTPGSGGAGACSANSTTTRAGGNGAHGIIVVTEFYG